MKLIYLACPYSDKSPKVEHDRFIAATICAANRMERKELIFSPITHSHPIRRYAGLEGDFEFWKDFCVATLTACQVMYVLTLPGYKESVGVQAELNIAYNLGMPIHYLDPETFDIIV